VWDELWGPRLALKSFVLAGLLFSASASMLSKTDTRFLTSAALSNPFELDASQMIIGLTKLSAKVKAAGKNFDQVYKAEILSSHAQAVKLFSTYSGSRRANATLRTVATGGLPTIKAHLNEARTLPKV